MDRNTAAVAVAGIVGAGTARDLPVIAGDGTGLCLAAKRACGDGGRSLGQSGRSGEAGKKKIGMTKLHDVHVHGMLQKQKGAALPRSAFGFIYWSFRRSLCA